MNRMHGFFLVVVVIAIAVVVAWVWVDVANVTHETKLTSEQEACKSFLGKDSSIGVTFTTDGKSLTFSTGDNQKRPPVVDVSVIQAVTDCFAKLAQTAFVLPKDFERIPQATTLGSALDNFSNAYGASTSTLNVSLQPALDQQLNNLIIPANAGPRWAVVKSWCETPPLNACLSCSGTLDEKATFVILSEKTGAQFTSEPLGPAGPPAADGSRPPWELVENGKHMGFHCGL